MIIKLAPQTINRIAAEASRVARGNVPDPGHNAWHIEPVAAQALYDLMIDKRAVSAIKDAVPSWAFSRRFDVSVGVALSDASEDDMKRVRPTASGIVQDCLFRHGIGFVSDKPGIKRIYYQHGTMIAQLDGDGSAIENPDLRTFLQTQHEVNVARAEKEKVGTEAQEKMLALLRRYNTLQRAIKAEGPWLLEYLPYDLLELYRQPAPKRKKPTPVDDKPVDVDFLIAHAGIKTLGLGGGDNVLCDNF